MAIAKRRLHSLLTGVSVGGLLFAAGCQSAPCLAYRPSSYMQLATPATPPGEPICIDPAAELPADGPLTFAQFVELAVRHSPNLRIAEAQVEAAQGKFIQAGLYPNPLVGWQASDLGSKAAGAGKQGPALTQNIVTADKLEIAQSAAGHGVAAADWQAVTHWYDVMGKLRAAYYAALASQREVQVNGELTRIAENSFTAAEKFAKVIGNKPDELRAQVELEQARNRLAVAERRAEASWRLLATAAGLAQLPQRPLAGKLEDAVPEYDYATLQKAILAGNSELLTARAFIAEAEMLLRRAEVEVVPDVQLFVQPEYLFDDQRLGAQAGISVILPVFNRNQGNIRAARAELAKAHETLRQTELKLTEELAAAFQRYQAARLLSRNIELKILPNAQESLRLILLAYEKGDPRFDYTAVQQAQNVLAQARLGYVDALADLQKAVSDLEALLQRDLGAFFRIPMPQTRQ